MIDSARIKSLDAEKKLLTVSHIRKLEYEIEKLMKQKAELQDLLDKHVNKQIAKK